MVFRSAIPRGATKIVTRQTPTTAEGWPESRSRTVLLPSTVDMPVGKWLPLRPELNYRTRQIRVTCLTSGGVQYCLPPTHSPWAVGTPWLKQRQGYLVVAVWRWNNFLRD